MKSMSLTAVGFIALIVIFAGGLIGTQVWAQLGGPDDRAGAADDGADTPIMGEALERASEAALAFMGGGQVTGTEVGDEEGYYEVEVTLDDGSQVDVHLDKDFNVVSTEGDMPDSD